jgi:hypothetical protein
LFCRLIIERTRRVIRVFLSFLKKVGIFSPPPDSIPTSAAPTWRRAIASTTGRKEKSLASPFYWNKA